jgi:hypothetical protein
MIWCVIKLYIKKKKRLTEKQVLSCSPSLTRSPNGLSANPGSHAEGVLATIHCHTQGSHHFHHSITGISQSCTLAWELGCPHPVPTALHILETGDSALEQKRNAEGPEVQEAWELMSVQ